MNISRQSEYDLYKKKISSRNIGESGGGCYVSDEFYGDISYDKITQNDLLITQYTAGNKYKVGNVISMHEIIILYMFGEDGEQ